MRWWLLPTLAVAISCARPTNITPPPDPHASRDPASSRRARFVEAIAAGVHAYQLLLARKSTRADRACWTTSDDVARLEALVAHFTSLVTEKVDTLRAWADSAPSTFDPKRDLDPLVAAAGRFTMSPRLPLRAIEADLVQYGCSDPSRARALAVLYQLVLEVERDGDVLQDELRLVAALGLPISPKDCGASGSDEDFLAMGRRLAATTCAAPFDVDAKAWQIAGRKLWNWAEKMRGERGASQIAGELAREPEIAALFPRLARLSPRRIVVLGHSYTMSAHWATPASFTDVAAKLIARVNSRVTITHESSGGMTARRALERLPEVLAGHPDEILLVVVLESEEDFKALRTIGTKAREAHVRLDTFDDVTAPLARPGASVEIARLRTIARETAMGVIDVSDRLKGADDRDQFVCLDGDHMKEPYHRFMAGAWLAHLASRETR